MDTGVSIFGKRALDPKWDEKEHNLHHPDLNANDIVICDCPECRDLERILLERNKNKPHIRGYGIRPR